MRAGLSSLSGRHSYYRKFRSTVIIDVCPGVLFFSLVAVLVAVVTELTSTSLAISNQMLIVLGTVLGLVISFRTSTSYERYAEGRKLWTSLAIGSRNLAQIIWIHVPFERVNESTGKTQPRVEVVIEKKSMINLVQAYSVSVKHLLRGEAGVYYADLYPLISFLPRFSTQSERATEDDTLPLWHGSHMNYHQFQYMHETMNTPALSHAWTTPLPEIDKSEELATSEEHHMRHFPSLMACPKRVKSFDPEAVLPAIPSEHPLLPPRNPLKNSYLDYIPFLRKLRSNKSKDSQPAQRPTRTITGKKIRLKAADSSVPMEITLFLSTYFISLVGKGLLTPTSATAMNNALVTLQDTVAHLERIIDTPLPFAYQVHLRMSVWIYLFLLPFQIQESLKWLSIPATAFASFLFLGFLEIGHEIENPFDYELNDLDLDHFCLCIQRELHEITAHPTPDPDGFIFTIWNQPFAPADRRNAKEIKESIEHKYHGVHTGMHHIRKTLLKSWRDVDEMTRH